MLLHGEVYSQAIEINMRACRQTKAYEIVICSYKRIYIDKYVHTYASTDNNFTRVLSLTLLVANSRDWLEIIAKEKLSSK